MAKRYKLFIDPEADCYCEIDHHPEGSYVHLDDYASLERELAEAQADLAYARSTGDECALEVDGLRRELAEAKMRRDEWIKESCRLGLIAENAQRELADQKAIVDRYCSRHDLKSCACEFGNDSDEPISECDYHKARSRELAEARVRWAGCEAAYYDLRKERDRLTDELAEARELLREARDGLSNFQGIYSANFAGPASRIDAFLKEQK